MEGEVEVEASVCAICLDKAGNQGPQGTGELNGCSHIFCYSCILEWSNVANSCPLCKQKFTRLTQSQVLPPSPLFITSQINWPIS